MTFATVVEIWSVLGARTYVQYIKRLILIQLDTRLPQVTRLWFEVHDERSKNL